MGWFMCELFFNYSTTSVIYTYGHPLSLHDTLPISIIHRLKNRVSVIIGVGDDFHQHHVILQPINEERQVVPFDFLGEQFTDVSVALRHVDRKSTRLNSSH